jgi:cholesterol oxidase
MRPEYDVVVIGSGFGGAITACRLAEAGRSVCVLERGREWKGTQFPRTPSEVSKAFWRENEQFGFIEYKSFRRIDVIQGCGVGGGSLHYFNVHLRPNEAIFAGRWPRAVTRKTLDPYYDLAESMLESKPLDPPAGETLPYRTRAFMESVKRTGRIPELVPIGVYTGERRLNPWSGLPQDPCDYSGNCMLGCTEQAKNTLDLNYIPLARKHGAEVHPLHEVRSIEPGTTGGYVIRFRRLDPDRPGHSEPGEVHATTVVVSAGTLGTNELLLRCRDEHRTLPELGPALGRGFSGNGDFILAMTAGTEWAVDPGRGPSITAGADFSTVDNKIYIEDVGFPDPFVWMLEGALPTSGRLLNLARGLWTYVLDLAGIGHGRIALEADRLFAGGPTTRMLPYLGMGTDAADGVMRLKGGALDLDWRNRRSRRMFREMEAAMKELSRAAGGKYLTSILWKWPFRRLLTAHPLGGCAMGDDPASSVVNDSGEAWTYPGLYISDGSIIPGALAVNPSLTISALAERSAFRMIHGRKIDHNVTEGNRR